MAKRSARTRRQLPRVALLVETTRSYGREVLRGVADYARIYGPWLFYIPVEMPVTEIPSEDEWDGEGIIAQPRQNPRFLKQLANRGVPVVNLSGPPGAGGLPAVRANQEAVADLPSPISAIAASPASATAPARASAPGRQRVTSSRRWPSDRDIAARSTRRD